MLLNVLKFAWNCTMILEEGKQKILCGIQTWKVWVKFLYPQPPEEEEEEEEGEEEEEESLDKL